MIDCAGGTVAAGFWNSHVHFTQPSLERRRDRTGRAPHHRAARDADVVRRRARARYGLGAGQHRGAAPAHRERGGPRSDDHDGGREHRAGGRKPATTSCPPDCPRPRAPPRWWRSSRPRSIGAPKGSSSSPARGPRRARSWSCRSRWCAPPRRRRTAAGRFVIAHPSNSAGARAAIEGGVDILAHTFPAGPDRDRGTAPCPGSCASAGMALIPTLKLWPYELAKAGAPAEVTRLVLGNGQAQLKAYIDLGWAGPVRHRRRLHDGVRPDR